MIFVGSVIKVIDNSGAKKVRCIKILKSSSRKYGVVGSPIIVSVQTINPLKKIKKGEIYRAIIVAIKKGIQRANGATMLFNINSVVIVNNKNLPLATRLLRPVMSELRNFKYSKIISMSASAL